MNAWFCVLNGVNTLFGGYFLYNALTAGEIISRRIGEHYRFFSKITGEAASYLYAFTYALLSGLAENPLMVITVGLGLVPLAFSLLFWLIPLVRSRKVKKRNETVKFENLRKIAFSHVWESPRNVKSGDFTANTAEAQPVNMAKAQDKLIKEIGVYSQPDVSVDATGAALYTFPEIEREKIALKTYRTSMRNADLGRAVFDSDS
jgi:hypothetical protein